MGGADTARGRVCTVNDDRFRAMLARLLDPDHQDDPIDMMLPLALQLTTSGPTNPSLAFKAKQYDEDPVALVIDETQRSALLAVLPLFLRSSWPDLPPGWVFYLLDKLFSDLGVPAALQLVDASRSATPEFTEGYATQLVIYLGEFMDRPDVAALLTDLGRLDDWPGADQLSTLLEFHATWRRPTRRFAPWRKG